MDNSTIAPKWTKPAVMLPLGAALALLTALFPIALLLAPACWAAGARGSRPAALALPLGIFGGILLLLYGGAQWSFFFCLFALGAACALGVYFMQAKGVGWFNTAAALSAGSILILYLCVCLPGILSGEGAFAAVQASIDEFMAILRPMAEAQVQSMDASRGELVELYFDSMATAASTTLVPMLCLGGMALGLSNTLFFRLFCRGMQPPAAPMRPFRRWSIPQGYTVGIFVLLIGSVALEFTGADYSYALSNTVNILVGVPLVIQGLCVVDDWIVVRARGKKPGGKRVLVYLPLGLVVLLWPTPLMLLGCLEQVAHLRGRAQTPPAQSL